MRNRRSWKSPLLFSAFLVVLASGCTTVGQPRPDPPPVAVAGSLQTEAMGWWYARFRIQWPENAEPRWHMDVLLATELLAPIIEEYRDEVALWRFHRRAARDASGHQFSFIFYAPPETAARIYESIRKSPLVGELQAEGEVLDVSYDDVGAVRKPNMEDTSDPTWSPMLQRSWPYFIMGVSELWLTLVTQVVESHTSGAPESPRAKLDFYEQVDRTVQALWRHEGGHALLHHLNAIFQYEPLMVNRREAMRF
ncbi:MAG: hypothetical protein MUC41_16070 [Syntrophobacteraceae bacterium]|nr:hypothetical protein [Syntrophobacteraceae bacterium]